MFNRIMILIMLYSIAYPVRFGYALQLKKTITGDISPKSVVHSGNGLFFAQNMMYRHTVTVYDRNYRLVKTIPDRVRLADYGYKKYSGIHLGSPVECAFSHNGRYAWVSNYCMYGAGFSRPGDDKGGPSGNYDKSFLYQIDTQTFAIKDAILVGSVPKYVATTPDNRLVLVTNWCSFDLSIIDTKGNRLIKTIYLGAFPRGIAVHPVLQLAYVAVMGSYDIATINLKDFSVSWIKNVGRSPRHLNIDPSGEFLYATLNGESNVAKIDLKTNKLVTKIYTGSAPRSMIINEDGSFIYVVNYYSNTMSKIRTGDMKVVETVPTNAVPIGITYDAETKEVWVCCYGGTIMIFSDTTR